MREVSVRTSIVVSLIRKSRGWLSCGLAARIAAPASALAIEDAGGKVVGPTASCEEALALLGTAEVAAAILDVNLVDGDCSALVDVVWVSTSQS